MIPEGSAGAVWRRSSRSNSSGGQCVEVALTPVAGVVRDSKNTGPELVFAPPRLTAFLGAVRHGRFDN